MPAGAIGAQLTMTEKHYWSDCHEVDRFHSLPSSHQTIAGARGKRRPNNLILILNVSPSSIPPKEFSMKRKSIPNVREANCGVSPLFAIIDYISWTNWRS